MPNDEIKYLADKVHVHRWPHDTPIWDDFTKKQLDDLINKNSEKKQIIVKDKIVQVEKFEFNSLKKIGVSVPLFKNECTMVFEAQFGELFAHVHISITSENYVDIFNKLISWKNMISPNDS
ncbi:MAG: hypothetical protein IIB02_09445 [Thaumarchaeota archaeon]|nr:hypothetical protein [Nitrososphaerota archaeon]